VGGGADLGDEREPEALGGELDIEVSVERVLEGDLLGSSEGGPQRRSDGELEMSVLHDSPVDQRGGGGGGGEGEYGGGMGKDALEIQLKMILGDVDRHAVERIPMEFEILSQEKRRRGGGGGGGGGVREEKEGRVTFSSR
jgi:hypothetical protein